MNIFSVVNKACKKTVNKRFDRWLNRRVPSCFQHTLSNRNIFILPTRFGFMYLFFDVLLFLLGTNYQNNIILLLSYLLASLFITVMMHSFYNFSRLTFSSNSKQTCFATQIINFPITITGHKSHFDIHFNFAKPQHFVKEVKLACCSTEPINVLLPCSAKQRGVHVLGRVKVFSEYSLGLFITWSLLDFSHQAIVFPQPKRLTANQLLVIGLHDSDQENGIYMQTMAEGDDFSELKNYVPGESRTRIAWKQLARGQGKFSKHHQTQQEQGSVLWLTLSHMPSSDVEERLQFLCFLILEYSKNKQRYGLVLDIYSGTKSNAVIKIEPNSGYQHQEDCLIALANVKGLTYDY